MAKKKKQDQEKIPAGQALFDNIWLLFAASMAVSGLLYSVWGLIETLTLSPAP